MLVNSGLSQALALTSPLGDSRLFVVETGVIRVMSGGVLQATPFLDLSSKVDTDGERGLLGLAFDPGFAANGRSYVDYINKTSLNTVVARYLVGLPGGAQADPGSAQTILSLAQPNFSHHKGGWLGFRPGDNQKLYSATGEGGSSNDPSGNAQNGSSLLGKVLRIDVSGNTAGYSIAASNPFRNSFDRLTGDLWIAGVGQRARGN